MLTKIAINYSPNFTTPARNKKNIKYIVFHYTGMSSESKAIKRLTDVKSKVSCHYFIKKNGKIILMVPELFEAWHAGKSYWKNDISLNKSSIGIEISNKGHDFGYEKFSKSQIFSLIKLSKYLIKKYKIKKSNILGHSDIAYERKKDPGEKFPWKKLYKNNIGIWYKKSKFKSMEIDDKKLEKLFFKNLFKIGYRYFNKTRRSKNDTFLIKAFQRRFLLSNVTGKIDQKTYKISYFLAKQVKN